MHHWYNPLLSHHSQHFLQLFYPNVELPLHLLRCNEKVSCIWLHRIGLHAPNIYSSDELFRHRSLHEHIYNATHDSISFKLTNFWSPCNLTGLTTFLLLLSLYQIQSNQMSIPLYITRHDNESTLRDISLGWNSWIKIYCHSISSEKDEHLFMSDTNL